MNGYPNRNCNRQNSVGITWKLLARYPGNLFLGAYVEKCYCCSVGPLRIGNGICIGMQFFATTVLDSSPVYVCILTFLLYAAWFSYSACGYWYFDIDILRRPLY